MNDPVGFDVVNGRVTDPKPWQALLAPNLGHELTHMYLAGYMVAGFIVAGVYATAWLRGRRDLYHRTGLVVALSFACFASGAQGLAGDWAGRRVAVSQPVKLASFEGVPKTHDRCAVHDRRLVRRRARRGALRDRDPQAPVAARPRTTRTAASSASTRCRPTTARP